ncbi:Glucosaminyl phosphatidylinositol (GlcN-PI) nositol acylation protein [Ceratobasidium sp. 392]|nr:Glucosaminyl phosphatidylinositol (GlcN-PI) nositol acylation protein [Ceratobasidium sp. 392]
MASYKLEKEGFVSGHNGSSVTHINAISSVALSSVALYLALQSRLAFPSRLSNPGRRNFVELIAEFTLLVAPLLLSLTVFAEYPLRLSLFLFIPAFLTQRYLPALPLPPPPALLPPPSPSSSRPASPAHTPTGAQSPHSSIHVPATPTPTPTPRRTAFAFSNGVAVPPLPALTTYRAHMMLMTVLGILAVDFPIFPRELSKCESWGVSVMDLGVGSFVFSQGVVSAIPMIKNPGILKGAVIPKALTTSRKVIPLFALGLVRVLAVKGTEYPEHVTEYGVHWNFFITLALLPPISVLFHPLITRVPLSLLGLLVTLVHQIVLNNTSLQSWALGDDRSTLLSQNKEGIVSFAGYLALHLFGLAIGTLILPPSPSHFRRAVSELNTTGSNTAPPSRAPSPGRLHVDHNLHMGRRPPTPDSSDDDEPRQRPPPIRTAEQQEPRKRGKAAIELCSYAVVWWSLFMIGSAFAGGSQGVSRRLANTLYVLWVAAFNTTFLLGYVILDSIFGRPVHPHTASRSNSFPTAKERLVASSPMRNSFAPSFKFSTGSDSIRERVPPTETDSSGLLGAINLNGLALFLAANVATGLVNMSIRTMYTADGDALLILGAYGFAFSLKIPISPISKGPASSTMY